jgi:hypothetical protein
MTQVKQVQAAARLCAFDILEHMLKTSIDLRMKEVNRHLAASFLQSRIRRLRSLKSFQDLFEQAKMSLSQKKILFFCYFLYVWDIFQKINA